MKKISLFLIAFMLLVTSYSQYRELSWDSKLLYDHRHNSDWKRSQEKKRKTLESLIDQGKPSDVQNFLDTSAYSFKHNYKINNPFGQAIRKNNDSILHVLFINHYFTLVELDEYKEIAQRDFYSEITSFYHLAANYTSYADTLYRAVLNFDNNYIDDYVKRGKNINFKTSYGENVLHVLLKDLKKEEENIADYEEMLIFLINNGVKCFAREEENNGQTPLFFAVKYGSGKMVKHIYQSCSNAYFDTTQIVINAIYNKDVSVLSEVSKFIDLTNIELPNQENLLHYVVENSLTQHINYLLEAGIEPNQKNEYGITPIVLGIKDIQYDTNLIYLLNHSDVNITTNNKESCLTLALRAKIDVSIIAMLLEKGANVNHTFEKEYKIIAPIFLAIDKESADYISLLLDHNVNLKLKNHLGETPLKYAKSKAKNYKKQYGEDNAKLLEIISLLSN